MVSRDHLTGFPFRAFRTCLSEGEEQVRFRFSGECIRATGACFVSGEQIRASVECLRFRLFGRSTFFEKGAGLRILVDTVLGSDAELPLRTFRCTHIVPDSQSCDSKGP